MSALGSIFKKLSSSYGDDTARNIVGNYGDDIAELGNKSLLGRYTSGEALPDKERFTTPYLLGTVGALPAVGALSGLFNSGGGDYGNA